jgi:thioredoxin reductase
MAGVSSVSTLRPAASWTSPPPTRSSPRIRAIANEIAANTEANPTKFAAETNWPSAAIVFPDQPETIAWAWIPARITPAAAFVSIGLDPNTAFLRESLELDRWGFLSTDHELSTSIPGVIAAGDVRAGSMKQLGAAIGEGISALLHVREYLHKIGDVAEHVAD